MFVTNIQNNRSFFLQDITKCMHVVLPNEFTFLKKKQDTPLKLEVERASVMKRYYKRIA